MYFHKVSNHIFFTRSRIVLWIFDSSAHIYFQVYGIHEEEIMCSEDIYLRSIISKQFLQCFPSWTSSSGLYDISLLSYNASATSSGRWWVTFLVLDAKGGVKGKKWCWSKGELSREVMQMQVLSKNWSLISSQACIASSLLHIYLSLWTYGVFLSLNNGLYLLLCFWTFGL
jgi:hypothetical protein